MAGGRGGGGWAAVVISPVDGSQAARNRSGQHYLHPTATATPTSSATSSGFTNSLARRGQQAGWGMLARPPSDKPWDRTCWGWWLVWVCWESITLGNESPPLFAPQFPQ